MQEKEPQASPSTTRAVGVRVRSNSVDEACEGGRARRDSPGAGRSELQTEARVEARAVLDVVTDLVVEPGPSDVLVVENVGALDEDLSAVRHVIRHRRVDLIVSTTYHRLGARTIGDRIRERFATVVSDACRDAVLLVEDGGVLRVAQAHH